MKKHPRGIASQTTHLTRVTRFTLLTLVHSDALQRDDSRWLARLVPAVAPDLRGELHARIRRVLSQLRLNVLLYAHVYCVESSHAAVLRDRVQHGCELEHVHASDDLVVSVEHVFGAFEQFVVQ